MEAIPVYLGLMRDKPDGERRRITRMASLYALLRSLLFLVFGTLLLRLFDVPMSIVRAAGGVIAGGGSNGDPAFVPLAIPIMFGPGAIATVIGMATTIKRSPAGTFQFAVACAAIAVCMLVTYLSFVYAKPVLARMLISIRGDDAGTPRHAGGGAAER